MTRVLGDDKEFDGKKPKSTTKEGLDIDDDPSLRKARREAEINGLILSGAKYMTDSATDKLRPLK